MALFTVLTLVVALSAVVHRWGVDSRDSCDWVDRCQPR